MKSAQSSVLVAAVIVVAMAAYLSIFVVDETEQVIITQFGKPVGEAVADPGLHFKVPVVQTANYFDKRFLEWDGDPSQVPTKDKRFIWVDIYARWRIADPLLFFQRVRDERQAQSRLDDILDGETRNAIASHDLVHVVRSTNRTPQATEDFTETELAATFSRIEFGREQITQSILQAAAPRTAELGIELMDLRFKRINYIEEVQAKIFERMISERQRMAEQFRSEGQGESSRIMGDKERDLKQIQSGAYRTAEEIKGKADAEAAAIYAAAYDRSPESRRFYRFLKTMETYGSTFGAEDWLILSTEGDYYRFLADDAGRRARGSD